MSDRTSWMLPLVTGLVTGLVVALAGCDDATTPVTPAASPSQPGSPGTTAPPTSRSDPMAALPTPPTAAPAPATPPPAPAPPSDDRTAAFLGMVGPKPPTWIWQPPTSVMRAANYVVPGHDGGNQAHVVVFKGIGGGTDANIRRWKNQFRTPEQREVEPVITTFEVAGMPVTLIDLEGEQMKMGMRWYTAGQRMVAAIIEAEAGPIHITLSGDADTVARHRDDFETMVRGLKPAE